LERTPRYRPLWLWRRDGSQRRDSSGAVSRPFSSPTHVARSLRRPTWPARPLSRPMGAARRLSRPTSPARPPSRPSWVAFMRAVPAFKRVGVNRLWWRVPLARPSGSAQIVFRGQWGAVEALHVFQPPAGALVGPRGCPFFVCLGPREVGPAKGWALSRRRTAGGSGRDAATRLLRVARTPTCFVARFSSAPQQLYVIGGRQAPPLSSYLLVPARAQPPPKGLLNPPPPYRQ